MPDATILVVEDHAELAEFITKFFEAEGYKVHYAENGADAKHLLSTESIDLALLDIRLPDMDGYEIADFILHEPTTAHIAVILLTERRDRPDRLRGLELGVVDYMTKPFDLDELRLRVRNVLQRYQQRHTVDAVTKLPLPTTTHESLSQALAGTTPWAMVSMLIEGLDTFRSEYGFIAADDFQRALIITLRAALRDVGQNDAFVGHVSDSELIVITDVEHKSATIQSIRSRMDESVPLFLPKRARDQKVGPLTVNLISVDRENAAITSVDSLHRALFDARGTQPSPEMNADTLPPVDSTPAAPEEPATPVIE